MFSNLSLSASVQRSDKRFSCNKNYFRIIHIIELLLEAHKARNAVLLASNHFIADYASEMKSANRMISFQLLCHRRCNVMFAVDELLFV